MDEIEVLYHGTKFKKTADKILNEGFKKWSYFATDLNTAIGHGGKYVFEVAFLKKDLPDFWQVRCENAISPSRIINLKKYKVEEIYTNKKTRNNVYSNTLEFSYRIPYCFREKKNEFEQNLHK